VALPGELADGRVPLFLVTGFLGSGKTTLLNHLLAQPELAKTAVLINEFGEVGIDNLLVSEVRGDLLLLASGCVCCQYLGELTEAVKDLFAKREAGEIPRFDRIVLETTGLADPVKLVDTSVNDPAMSLLVYLDSVVVTVDAVLAQTELAEQPEPAKQVSLADRIVLTKVDLVTEEQVTAVRRELARLNPVAPVKPTVLGRVDPEELLGAGTLEGVAGDLAEAISAVPEAPPHDSARAERLKEWLWAPEATPHNSARSFTVRLEGPLQFPLFASWFARLTRDEGNRLLRVKGVLHTRDDERPLVVQSVQWILCPTHRLPAWPDDERSSRIVFIGRPLPMELEERIRAELEAIAEKSRALDEEKRALDDVAVPAAPRRSPPASLRRPPAPAPRPWWRRFF